MHPTMGSFSPERRDDTFAPPPPSSAILSSPSSSSFSSTSSFKSSSSSSCSSKYIEHPVSKFDTLAGVAIKYGVEIADIKKINGLTTDLQMFAHKILLIPLPGRHPPSTPIQSNGSFDDRGDSATNSPRRDVLDSLQLVKLDFLQNSEISPAMSTLQNYYDLLHHKNGSTAKSTEMTVYETRGASYSEDEMLPKASTASETQPRRSMCILRSCYHSDNSYYGNTLLLNKSGDASNCEKSKLDESIKRRQKADTDALSALEEIIEGFINRIGRGLAPKALLTSLMDYRSPTQDTSQTNSLLAVMKSFSSLSLQEENYSIWSYSRWSLKPDSITKPIFSSLPKQISAWRSKAALD